MYTELQKAAEAKGKTVQEITFSTIEGQVILAFTDETFLVLGVQHEYEGDDSVINQWLNLEGFGRDALVLSGIITEEELQQRLHQSREKELQAREGAERRQYERLKAKFGGA